MANEHESKYICKYIPEEASFPRHLLQGYVHVDKEKQVRVRITEGGEAEMCIKFMKEDREEFEATMLSREEGLKLYRLCGRKFVKIRRSLTLPNGCHCDIDEYSDGALIVEIEKPSKDFILTLPDFVGECVDKVFRYSNYYYAGITQEEFDNGKFETSI